MTLSYVFRREEPVFASFRPTVRTLSVTVALGFLAAGCAEPGQEEGLATEEGPAETEEAEVPDFSEEVRTEFEPGPGATGEVAGRLRLLVPVQGVNEPMKLAVQIAGLSPGPHAWHIHDAPCGEEGAVVIPFSDTEEIEGIGEPLEADEAGVAVDTVDVPPLDRVWVRAGGLSVHVHARPGVDHGPTVACAIL